MKIAFYRTLTASPYSKVAFWISWPTVLIFTVLLIAVIFGGMAAIYPASFSIKVGILVCGAVTFIAALLIPFGTRVPDVPLRYLLFTLLVVWVIWPPYLSYHGLPGPGINPTRLIYWSLVGLWFFWIIASKDLRTYLADRCANYRPFIVVLTIYLCWAFFCAIGSQVPFYSAYYFIKLMIGPVLIFFIALSCIRDKDDVDFALCMMVLAGLVACGLGGIEAIKKTNLFYEIVPSLFPQGDEGSELWAEQLLEDKSRAGAYRVMSTFAHPLAFGEYLALILPLAIYLAGFSRGMTQRAVGLIAIPAILAGAYLTHTRSTLLAIGVGLACIIGFFGFRAMKKRNNFLVSLVGFFSLVTLLLAVLALAGVATDLAVGRTSAEVGSTMARIIMLKRGVALALDSPLIGYGPGQAAATIGFLPGLSRLTIDNYYLSVVLESGLPGLFLFLFLLAYPIYRGFRAGLNNTGRVGARIALITFALVGFCVVRAILSLTYNFDPVFLLFALLLISLDKKLGGSLEDKETLGIV